MTRNLRMSAEEYHARTMRETKALIGPSPFRADVFALGRLKSGTMNKTEAEYAQRLEYGKHTGAILWYKFEAITLKLADDTRYTPDFAVLIAGGEFQLHEVKGFWQDDAKVKIKVAAAMFPFRFIAVRKLPKKEGGGWQNQEF